MRRLYVAARSFLWNVRTLGPLSWTVCALKNAAISTKAGARSGWAAVRGAPDSVRPSDGVGTRKPFAPDVLQSHIGMRDEVTADLAAEFRRRDRETGA